MHIHGGDIYGKKVKIDFSANINPLGMPERVRAAAVEGAERSECYPQAGSAELAAALSHHLKVEAAALTVGNGAAELIYACVRACGPRRAVVCAPTFAEYQEALEAAGCEIFYHVLQEQHEYRPQEDLIDKLEAGIDLVFFCNPNNPTGVLMPVDYMARLARRCREIGAVLVVDECFMDFVCDPEGYSLLSRIGQYPNLFLLKAFTKIYAMPGLRLGYGVCSDPLLSGRIIKQLQPWNVSLPAQRAGMAALQEADFVRCSAVYIREEKEFLYQGLRKLGVRVWKPSVNYVFFHGREGLDQRCRERGILIRNCANYQGLSEGYYRAAVRTRAENQVLLSVLRQEMK